MNHGKYVFAQICSFLPQRAFDTIAPENTFLNGQVVATQVRVLGTSNFNRTVNYYDDKYRLIQTTADNAAGGKDRITKILSFDGKTTNDYHSHTSRFYTTPLIIQETYTYDPMDRLLNVTHQTGTQEVVTITQNTYNELGQLLNKKIHQSPSHPGALQKLDYYYNIRGWLNSINRPVSTETGYEESDLFNMELHYNTGLSMPSSTAYYNGNIAEEVWKGGYDEYYRDYRFTYDQSNRLTDATYGYKFIDQYGAEWSLTKRYNESGISYDHNGNLLFLTRYHGDWNEIDYLAYQNYNGNQLGDVDDWSGSSSPVGFQDKNNGGNDYTYDANGNLTSDYNKSITSITYNYLNLPGTVTITAKGTITYSYDAAGNKLQKTTVDQTVTPGKTTNYYYAGDYVYRNDTLEFISHPEGRLRPVRIDTTQAISVSNLKYIYDYFLKDHLGSVRDVLTTGQDTDIYAATMETAAAAKENALFSNVSATATAVPAGFTNDNNNKMASRLNGDISISGNSRVGPAIVLKVMTGDTISISTWSWYTGPVQPPATGVSAIATDLLPLLTGGVAAGGGGQGGAIPTGTMDPLLSAALASFLSNDQSYVNTRPKAFLNWMVVDEEFNGVTSTNHMGAVQVPVCNTGDTLKPVTGPTNLVIRRNGWIYIYLSNESAQDVLFDNLVINLRHGPLLEQQDYYAFGMQIPGLSAQAYKYQYNQNRYKYNGIEYDSAFGFDEYEAHFRDLDPQIGRWTTIDPDIENGSEDISPYASMSDNPTLKTDPLGDEDESANGGGCCDVLLPGLYFSPGTAVRANDALKKTVRQIMIATGGAETGVIHAMTGGTTPTTPIFSGYTDEDLSQHYAGVDVGETLAPLFDIPIEGPELKLSPISDGATPSLKVNAPALPVARVNASGNTTPSKVQKSTHTESVGNGKYSKTTEIRPSKKSPGQSRAEYVRIKNKSGKTIKTYKDSYDRANKFQGRKPLTGGPEGRTD